jgi:hypothetical protein
MAVRRGLGILALGLLAAACGGANTPAPAMPEDEYALLTPDEANDAERDALARCGDVSAEGYCGVRFGMPAEEARKVFPVEFAGSEVRAGADVSEDRCYELFAVPPVTGVSFLVEGGKVGRIDVLTEAVRTSEGFGVGTQALAIRTHYGDGLYVETNALEPYIIDLTATVGDTKYVFEIQDGLVRSWRAGIEPTIAYVAHCG